MYRGWGYLHSLKRTNKQSSPKVFDAKKAKTYEPWYDNFTEVVQCPPSSPLAEVFTRNFPHLKGENTNRVANIIC